MNTLPSLTVAVGQFICRLGNIPGNINQACRLTEEASRQGAKLLLLPEGCLTGNAFNRPADQDTLPLTPEAIQPLQEVVDRTGTTVCPGAATPYASGINIVQAIIQPHTPPRWQHKAAKAKTEPYFLIPWPDVKRNIFYVDRWRVCILICSESAQRETRQSLSDCAPDLVLHPTAGSIPSDMVAEGPHTATRYATFQQDSQRVLTSASDMVREWGIPKISANPIGFDGQVHWPGNSYIIDKSGRILTSLPGENRPTAMRSGVVTATLVGDR